MVVIFLISRVDSNFVDAETLQLCVFPQLKKQKKHLIANDSFFKIEKV